MKIGVVHVILWTFGLRLLLEIIAPIAVALSPRFKEDLVMQAALLALLNLGACALFAGRRASRNWSETFALRPTGITLVVLSLLLGIAVIPPAYALAGFMERLAPPSDAEKAILEALLKPRSVAHGIALFIFAAGIGPFSEELLFRGALYTGLRPHHSAAYAGLATGVLFTISHHDVRSWPSILVLSGILAAVRAISGSLWPCFFLHALFNATGLAVPYLPSFVEHPSLWLVGACVPLSAAIVGVFAWAGRRSASADRARQADLEPDPGVGETES